MGGVFISPCPTHLPGWLGGWGFLKKAACILSTGPQSRAGQTAFLETTASQINNLLCLERNIKVEENKTQHTIKHTNKHLMGIPKGEKK